MKIQRGQADEVKRTRAPVELGASGQYSLC